MVKFLAVYLSTALAFLLPDAVWLTQVGPNLYRPALDPLLADAPRLAPAVGFYLIYVLGIVVLAVRPWAHGAGGVWGAAARGAMLGLTAYGTYDLTNHATLKVWSLTVTLADMGWGLVLTGFAAAAGALAARTLRRRFG